MFRHFFDYDNYIFETVNLIRELKTPLRDACVQIYYVRQIIENLIVSRFTPSINNANWLFF